MAKCVKCIHFDVCYLTEIDNDIRDTGENPNCVHYTPTADVVEVKHGEWIEDSLVDDASICSLCGYTDYRFNYDRDERGSNYCPHCGAKMDGRSDL